MSSAFDDLQWQAMQYVLDELSDAEREAFESRLADDLSACEAVTSASRLMMTTQSAMQNSPRPSPLVVATPVVATPVSRGGAWLVVALTTSVALLCVVALQSSVSGPAGPVAGVQDSVELVSLWRSGMDVDGADDDDADDAGDAANDAVPSWMLAAVSFEAAAVDGQPEKAQEN